ncbi:glycine cleavage system transcriptional repressor [Desulfobotulus alkaliphilus]|uniref:Glycine cleavage system transcriptional repressor n=1 Tax=Desulfobotulus alkaliphilus TaxID=622671 RepID=A0A562RPB4_9BACT|nr:ACT domain-containing protein [Desulfobotulus alkaliphilus]TWI70783.1 glycine cleavage system transcriptional repressor [Desulfobotulus alkaliphilus]
MKKVIVTVLANDRPGILASVSGAIFQEGGNLDQVSQTLLETQFAGLFIATLTKDISIEDLQAKLRQTLAPQGMDVLVKPIDEPDTASPVPSEPFVITCFGPDRKGLVAEITAILARHKVNVTNLRAMFEGGDDPSRNLMIYEVDVPVSADTSALSGDLRTRAAELSLVINIQHRNIFESITRM